MKIIDSFPFDGKRIRKYDWDMLLDGQCRELTKGLDFICSTTSFIASAYNSASRRGIKVRISVSDDTVYMQAIREKAKT